MLPISSAETSSSETNTSPSLWERQRSAETMQTLLESPRAGEVEVHNWPEEAKPLKRQTWLTWLYSIGDVILVLLPVYFFFLGGAAISLNNQPIKGNLFGRQVEKAITLGPTIFPIMFAAISGRSMKMIARFLAERGAKLGTLELLMASQSVWGTFESQFLLRKLTLVGAHLILFWALSPFGGQASLRLLHHGQVANSSFAKLRYLSTGPVATFFSSLSSWSVDGHTETKALFAAVLLTRPSEKLGPQDIWGNVKIPSLRAVNGSRPDSEGWLTVPTISAAEQYISLVGIPVIGRPNNGSAVYNLEVSYIETECGLFKQLPLESFPDGVEQLKLVDSLVPGQFSYYTGYPSDVNDQRRTLFFQTYLDLYELIHPVEKSARYNAYFGAQQRSGLNASSSAPRTITLVSQTIIRLPHGIQNVFNTVNCSLYQQHVEAQVQCGSTDCTTTRIRKSRTDNRPLEFTPLEEDGLAGIVLTKMPWAVAQSDTGSNPTERFLFNTSGSLVSTNDQPYGCFPKSKECLTDFDSSNCPTKGTCCHCSQSFVDLTLVDSKDISLRLSTLINTYYQLELKPRAYLGDLPVNYTLYGIDTIPGAEAHAYMPTDFAKSNFSIDSQELWDTTPFRKSDTIFIGATTNATLTNTQDVYRYQPGWVALLFVASAGAFILGVTSLILKHRTLSPDLFGFVTSMTYENPYVSLPKGGNVLDAMERARLLRDLKFHVGDVRGDEETGHIAFASGEPKRKLERGRLYL